MKSRRFFDIDRKNVFARLVKIFKKMSLAIGLGASFSFRSRGKLNKLFCTTITRRYVAIQHIDGRREALCIYLKIFEYIESGKFYLKLTVCF